MNTEYNSRQDEIFVVKLVSNYILFMFTIQHTSGFLAFINDQEPSLKMTISKYLE